MRKDAPIISCFHVTIDAPTGQRLLDDVTLELNYGSWNEIYGPPRAGKSILFDVLSLRGIPRRGKLVVDGRNLERSTEREIADMRRMLGSCGETPRLLEQRTVVENLVLPFVIRGQQARALGEAEALLDVMECEGLRDQQVRHLCRRDRLLVGLMRAMIGKPDAILVDGAHELLDDRSGQLVMQQLKRRHADGSAIVLFGREATDNARRGRQFRLNAGALAELETPAQIPRVPEVEKRGAGKKGGLRR
jgi:ABC-type ATPase involved in cell division